MKKHIGNLLLGLIVIISVIYSTSLLLKGRKEYPQPKSNLWEKFSECKVGKHYIDMNYSIDFTDEVKNLDGKIVNLDGYIIPIESKESFSHFLLSIRSPSCPYCPAGQPNEMIEVFTKEPIKWHDRLETITGKLQLGKNISEDGVFFKMVDAKIGNLNSTEQKQYVEKQVGYKIFQVDKSNLKATYEITLNELKGKKSLLLFWRSDCPPCQREIEQLPDILKDNSDISIFLLSLNGLEKLPKSLINTTPNLNLLLVEGDARKLFLDFENNKTLALPFSAMLDGNGKICNKYNGILNKDKISEWKSLCK